MAKLIPDEFNDFSADFVVVRIDSLLVRLQRLDFDWSTSDVRMSSVLFEFSKSELLDVFD